MFSPYFLLLLAIRKVPCAHHVIHPNSLPETQFWCLSHLSKFVNVPSWSKKMELNYLAWDLIQGSLYYRKLNCTHLKLLKYIYRKLRWINCCSLAFSIQSSSTLSPSSFGKLSFLQLYAGLFFCSFVLCCVCFQFLYTANQNALPCSGQWMSTNNLSVWSS